MCKTENLIRMEDSLIVKQEIQDILDIEIIESHLIGFNNEFEIKNESINKNIETFNPFETAYYLHEDNNHSDKFKCGLFNYCTDSKSSLETSTFLKHTETEANAQNMFNCAYCDYSSKIKRNLKNHISVKHSKAIDQSAFKCAHCNYSSKCKRSLTTHIMVKHIGANDFKLNTFNCADKNLFTTEKNKQLSCSTNILKKSNKRRHNCLYCDTFVNHFSRHLERHHRDETQVQHFLSFNKSDKTRKDIISKIRKQGDFCAGEIIPLRNKSNIKEETNKNNSCQLLPCIHCKGYYSRNYLHRHVKECSCNKDKNASCVRKTHQSQSHTLMASNFKLNDPLLTSGLLDSLKADEISLVAKRDKVICEVGRRYIKNYKGKYSLQVPKQYMRQLARLLIEVRQMKNDNSLTFLSLLDPSKFKVLIQATKNISQYDNTKKTFNSPSLALQMGYIIKKGIAAAHSMEIKLDANCSNLNNLNFLKRIIKEEWANQISTETTQQKPINISRINETSIIPVAEDLLKLKNYLDTLISESKRKLIANNKDEKAYINLVEGTYCSLFLFNKRHVGELQRILLNKYQTKLDNSSSAEFEISLTISEKILLQKLNFIVKHGKRGSEVPVLLDKLTQNGIDFAIEHRKYFHEISNPYLFALCYSNSCISGYHVFRKHVTNALGDPDKASALTSTKLRDHLATILQISKMEPEELEQLATFLGYSVKIHSEWYQLPSDVYKTTEVSKKLLILAQEGSIVKYKGRVLDKLDLSNDICETQTYSDQKVAEVHDNIYEIGNVSENVNLGQNQVYAKKKITRKTWTEKEKRVTEIFFKNHIKNKVAPKKREVTELMQNYPELFQNRKWDVIKAYVYNQYKDQDLGDGIIQNHADDDKEVTTVQEDINEIGNVSKNINLGHNEECAKKKITRKTWTEKEKRVTENFFKEHIKNKVAPKKREVTKLMQNYPELFQNRKWDVVKAYVYNQYKDRDLGDGIIQKQHDSDKEVPKVHDDINKIENVNLGQNQEYTNNKITRKAWTAKEKRVTKIFFRKHIKNKVAPKKEEVTVLMAKYPELFQNTKWDVVKAYVYNQYRKQY